MKLSQQQEKLEIIRNNTIPGKKNTKRISQERENRKEGTSKRNNNDESGA